MYQAPNQLHSNFNSQRYNSNRGRGGRGRGRGGFRGRGRGGITGRGRGGFRGRGRGRERGYENYKTRRIINNNQSNFNNFNPNPNFVNTNNQNQNNFNNFNNQQQNFQKRNNQQQQNFQKEKETPTLKEIEKKIQNAQSNTNNKLGDLESKDQEKAQKVFQYLKTFRVFCKNNNLNMAENLLSDIENVSVVLANVINTELKAHKSLKKYNNLMPNNYKKNPKKKISQEFYTNPVLRRLKSKTSGKYAKSKYDLKEFQNSNMAKLILNTIDIRTYLTGTLSTFPELKEKTELEPTWTEKELSAFIEHLAKRMSNCRPPKKKLYGVGIRTFYIDPVLIFACSNFTKEVLYWPDYWINDSIIGGKCESAVLTKDSHPLIIIKEVRRNYGFEASEYQMMPMLFAINDILINKIKAMSPEKDEKNNETKSLQYTPVFGIITDGEFWQFFKYDHSPEQIEKEPEINVTRLLSFAKEPEHIVGLIYKIIKFQLLNLQKH
ncbi:eukaryotic elongation factor 2 kinase-related [Anaeramoeba flamelloides]|uniref:Eukaryotic elongation factor 2 kinase-related n=1 Tax=Anaeramoeba flamelloides TaxID=1746091 RepID=A0ABQ8YFF0_9EUKA|nr:eukaryotic elongation factor 2 kinase-related [Anaeramoeba flamelloides]